MVYVNNYGAAATIRLFRAASVVHLVLKLHHTAAEDANQPVLLQMAHKILQKSDHDTSRPMRPQFTNSWIRVLVIRSDLRQSDDCMYGFYALQFDIRRIDHKIVASSPAGFFVHFDSMPWALCARTLAAAALPRAFITWSHWRGRRWVITLWSQRPNQRPGSRGQVWAGQSRAPVTHAKISRQRTILLFAHKIDLFCETHSCVQNQEYSDSA